MHELQSVVLFHINNFTHNIVLVISWLILTQSMSFHGVHVSIGQSLDYVEALEDGHTKKNLLLAL